ncbi:hypothetical protein V2W45_5618 [Cenococcum geophilum]
MTQPATTRISQIVELVLMILLELPFQDLVSGQEVCKQWRVIILGNISTRQKISLTPLTYAPTLKIAGTHRLRKRPAGSHRIALPKGD